MHQGIYKEREHNSVMYHLWYIASVWLPSITDHAPGDQCVNNRLFIELISSYDYRLYNMLVHCKSDEPLCRDTFHVAISFPPAFFSLYANRQLPLFLLSTSIHARIASNSTIASPIFRISPRIFALRFQQRKIRPPFSFLFEFFPNYLASVYNASANFSFLLPIFGLG